MLKILHNNLIIDLCPSERFLKYSKEQQRFIEVKRYCANAVLGSDGNTIYHLIGTPYTFSNKIKTVEAIEITELEYNQINNQMILQKTEGEEDLRKEIDDLKEKINQQNDLIQQLLNKLS